MSFWKLPPASFLKYSIEHVSPPPPTPPHALGGILIVLASMDQNMHKESRASHEEKCDESSTRRSYLLDFWRACLSNSLEDFITIWDFLCLYPLPQQFIQSLIDAIAKGTEHLSFNERQNLALLLLTMENNCDFVEKALQCIELSTFTSKYVSDMRSTVGASVGSVSKCQFWMRVPLSVPRPVMLFFVPPSFRKTICPIREFTTRLRRTCSQEEFKIPKERKDILVPFFVYAPDDVFEVFQSFL